MLRDRSVAATLWIAGANSAHDAPVNRAILQRINRKPAPKRGGSEHRGPQKAEIASNARRLTCKAEKLPMIAKLGYPLLVGPSRKGFLGATLAREGKPAPPPDRIWGTAATVTAAILNGAHIVRVHDVAEMVQVARVADCLVNPSLRRSL